VSNERHALIVPLGLAGALELLKTVMEGHASDTVSVVLGLGVVWVYAQWAQQQPWKPRPSAEAGSETIVAFVALLIGVIGILGFPVTIVAGLLLAGLAKNDEARRWAKALFTPGDRERAEAAAWTPPRTETVVRKATAKLKPVPEPAPIVPETLEAIVPEAPAVPAPEPLAPTSTLDNWGLSTTPTTYEPLTLSSSFDTFKSSSSGFDEALALLQGKRQEDQPKP
jgi:hypothetical protein